MRMLLLLALVLWQAAPEGARPEHMRYERGLRVTDSSAGPACAVLDAQIFPHASPSLKDLRILPLDGDRREVPYAITLSEAATDDTQAARVLNLAGVEGKIQFDLEMPARAYTSVALDIDPQVHDFVATATVSGMDAVGGKATALGEFRLFDLASQHLPRDTALALEESTFRYLHVAIGVADAGGGAAVRFGPEMVRGAEVPPSREAQILYTTVASVSAPATGVLASDRRSRYDIALPLRVPVERVSFDISPTYTANFRRNVTINASAETAAGATPGTSLPLEAVSGTISRVHSMQAGRLISEQRLTVPAVLGSNLQAPAHVWIEIEDGDEQPLPIAAVRLEMRQRKLCFNLPPDGSSGLALFYGDSRLAAPEYEYAQQFVASSKARVVTLGPETLNPGFRALVEEQQPFTERHPEVLWIVLIAAICALGTVALRSAKNVGR